MSMGGDRKGLSKRYIAQAVEDSLTRLQTDYIDLYQAHQDDPNTPLEETLAAFDGLIKANSWPILRAMCGDRTWAAKKRTGWRRTQLSASRNAATQDDNRPTGACPAQLRNGAPIATLDDDLLRAANKAGVKTFKPT
jgi:Aldo/keto reductase family